MKHYQKAFENWRHNAIHFKFPNGNTMSMIWTRGSYSDNYECFKEDESGELVMLPMHGEWLDSDTVEIMFDCGKKLEKRITKKYNDGYDQPVSRLTFSEWLEIMNLLHKEKRGNASDRTHKQE